MAEFMIGRHNPHKICYEAETILVTESEGKLKGLLNKLIKSKNKGLVPADVKSFYQKSMHGKPYHQQ